MIAELIDRITDSRLAGDAQPLTGFWWLRIRYYIRMIVLIYEYRPQHYGETWSIAIRIAHCISIGGYPVAQALNEALEARHSIGLL